LTKSFCHSHVELLYCPYNHYNLVVLWPWYHVSTDGSIGHQMDDLNRLPASGTESQNKLQCPEHMSSCYIDLDLIHHSNNHSHLQQTANTLSPVVFRVTFAHNLENF
jgi:hypothetical protein